ncbi:MAG: dihydrofolate reductase family protein, partial [Longimicrobiales bacterium]
LRYQVATSLDGFIADDKGGYDWIVMDPDIDFGALMAQFDTLLMGRGTYEIAGGGGPGFGDKAVYVVSTTLDPKQHKKVTIVSKDVEAFVADLKKQSGNDIWLFGGGVLFRSMLEAGLVDRVELAIIPVLLGAGIPVLPGLDGVAKLKLDEVTRYPKSGTMLLGYEVVRTER